MTNYSIYTIPFYWILALIPHAYASRLINTSPSPSSTTTKHRPSRLWNNISPRSPSTTALYQRSVPPEVFARYERAEAAHANLMENAAWFVGGIIGGSVVGVRDGTMNWVSVLYLLLRILYTVLYINTVTLKRSYLRSLSWALSTVLLMGLYIAAARKVAS